MTGTDFCAIPSANPFWALWRGREHGPGRLRRRPALNRIALILIALTYGASMFGGAAWAQRRRAQLERSPFRFYAYALALPVYCTSWTYFGAVGMAAAQGWGYLPIYVGPMLLFLLGGPFLMRLTAAVHAEGATSISDFIGSRFQKSRGVGALVTLLALLGTIPYLALQLRSVGISYALVSGTGAVIPPILCVAAGLALFAILFGTRVFDAAARNEGVLFAVAAESVVKLLALCGIALFAILLFVQAPDARQAAGLAALARTFRPTALGIDFPVVTLISVMAILCLPRQFYIGVMEARAPADIVRVRWTFILYLLLTVLAVVPITLTGLALLPDGAQPDFFVLALPMDAGAGWLALLVFLGGLSAAVAMAVTETIALSTMVSNDLIAPFLLRSQSEGANFGRILLLVRRATIVLLMGSAVAYAAFIPGDAQLASVGLIAFVAMAQSAPALVMAVLRPNNDAAAAKAGLSVGLILWLYTLFLPGVGGYLLPGTLENTLFDPHALLGIGGMSAITHGALWSLGGNMVAFAVVAARRIDRRDLSLRISRQRGIAQIDHRGALAEMVERFVGPEAVAEALGDGDPSAPIDRASARTAERLIASVVGASSARAIMASALSGASLGIEDVTQLLDASGQSLHFSQGLLAATLENIDPGVSVADRNLRLIAWNSRYLELFAYPPGMVRVGAPIADLIRFNAERGECGPGEVEGHVERRLHHMRSGHAHSFERHRADGRVIKTVGGPMPDGGYVMCFTDITAEAVAREALERARAELERRVAERTAELSEANRKLALAITDKTRFLAAASHDLLQPLHAARLFCASLQRDISDQGRVKLERVDRAIEAANDLLRALLDISKLDAGGIEPHPTHFSLRLLLAELVDGFEPLASERGLSLRLGPGDAAVFLDRTLLRSILQNFLSNAIRYTRRGGVLIGIRKRGAMVRIEVYDSGIGIPPESQERIFREFERLESEGEHGVGLGLAIVERSAPLVGGEVDLRSEPGRGSRFAITVPAAARPAAATEVPAARITDPVRGQRLLVVDDDPMIREAMAAFLTDRGHRPLVLPGAVEALACRESFDAALIDFHLGTDDGIDLITTMRAARPSLRAALITADRSPAMLERAAQHGIAVLSKPLAAPALDEWLARGTAKQEGSVLKAQA